MLKRILTTAVFVAPMLLAACGESPAEQKPEAAAPAAAIEPDPLPPDAPMPAPERVEASYECVPAMALSVAYDNSADSPKATVTVDGKTYEMTRALSASGARYMTLAGRTPGMALVWWNKGDEGFLQEGRGETMADETIIATCVEKSN